MTTFSKRNLECAPKSAENKRIANFIVKEILFQADKILFRKKLIVAQNRELNNKEMLANVLYSLYAIKKSESHSAGCLGSCCC